MSDQFANQFGDVITARVADGKLVFDHTDDLFEQGELPLHIDTLLSGYCVVNAKGKFAVVDAQELKWMVLKHIEFMEANHAE
jgi:hypothetical protein